LEGMPVEGHWERANTPLRTRDRKVLLVVAVVAVLAVIGLGVAYALRPAAQSNAGCVVAEVPSTMGGATVRSCGAQAHKLCRTQGRIDRLIAAACMTQGFAADVPRAPSG
jgi:hypothetical protein